VRAKPIRDEFSDLPISRQRKYQLRMQRDKRCVICGEPLANNEWYCLKHSVQARERARKTLGYQRRSYNARSYKLQAKATASASKETEKASRMRVAKASQ
jgi:hypothetical protein